jgi:choline dehydrogenase
MPRGRVLGGTSSLNGMVYLRGAASDYDGWAAAGCPGWEWTAVREAFAGLEAWQRPAVLAEHNLLSQAMVEAAVEAGLAPQSGLRRRDARRCRLEQVDHRRRRALQRPPGVHRPDPGPPRTCAS